MKKLALLLFFGIYSSFVSAQFLLGGQFNVSVLKDKDENAGGDDQESTTTFVMLIPRLAYVAGNTWYGIDAGVSLVNDKNNFFGTEVETKTTIATVAPFFRYMKKPSENFGLWIEGQAGASFGSEKNDDGDKTAKYAGLNIGLRPGVIFFIGEHLSFEASFGRLGYTSLTIEDPNNSSNKETISQVGFMLNSNSVLLDELTLNATSGFQFGANWLF